MQNLEVKIEKVEGSTLTVLTGEALKQKAPEKIEISGDIRTVSSFLRVRKDSGTGLQSIDKNRAVVLVDKKNRSIELQLDPENFYSPVITGTLADADELIPFNINTVKTFTKEELVKLIKFNKLFFSDATKHAEMLLAFQKVSSTVNISQKDSSDDRGNKERDFVKQVETNAPTEFVLDIPVYKGFPAYRFRVEVCLDVTEGSVRFWFESIELHELRMKLVEEIFTEELKEAEDFVIVNI